MGTEGQRDRGVPGAGGVGNVGTPGANAGGGEDEDGDIENQRDTGSHRDTGSEMKGERGEGERGGFLPAPPRAAAVP